LATIFETLGAVLIGFNTSDTIRKAIIDVGKSIKTIQISRLNSEMYASSPNALLLGQLAILGGGTIWLFCVIITLSI
jgi:phosphate/sulfate permease